MPISFVNFVENSVGNYILDNEDIHEEVIENFKNYTPIKAVGKATVDVILYKDIVGRINIEVVEK